MSDADWEDIQDKYQLMNVPEKVGELTKLIEFAWESDGKQARGGLYFLLDNLTKLLSEHLRALKEGRGSEWLQDFEYTDGSKPSEEEKTAILDAIENNKAVFEMLINDNKQDSKMMGGAGFPNPAGLMAKHSQIIQTPQLPFDISLDRGFERLRGYIDSIDEQVHAITDELGPTAFISKMATDPKIPLPFPPGVLPIPKNTILPFISMLLEAIKIFILVNPADFTTGRKIVSIVQAVYEFSLGNWRQSLLSLMGFFGKGVGLTATFGKFILNTWLFIEPSIRSKLEIYAFRGIKSMVVSFLIWLFHIFAPDILWMPISAFIKSLNAVLETATEQERALEAQLSQYLQTMGYTGYSVKLPTIDEIITDEKGAKLRLSYEDLQNIQRLLALPIIQCSKEGRAVMEPLLKTPARIIFELMNIPTTPDGLQEMCGVSDASMLPSMSEVIAKAVVEKTEIVPPQ
jgi:hypothetical protein